MIPDQNTCPICGGQLNKEVRVGHVNTGREAHGHLFKAFCASCQIVVERAIYGEQDTGWLSSSVNQQDIVGELSQEEVAQVEKSLAKYPTLLNQWREFVAQKQEADIICRFKREDIPYTGLTIRRGNHLIGQFWVFRNL